MDDNRRIIQVENTGPIWRLIAVMCATGALTVFAFYLKSVGHIDDFATIAVITAAFTVSFWAHKRPDQVKVRFGPFGKIANAVRESLDDIREWTYKRPLRVGVTLALCYGIAVVVAKHVLIMIVGALYTWHIAVAVGLAIGAVIAAPHMFKQMGQWLSVQRTQEPTESKRLHLQ